MSKQAIKESLYAYTPVIVIVLAVVIIVLIFSTMDLAEIRTWMGRHVSEITVGDIAVIAIIHAYLNRK